jgi:hypothetical protein
MDDLVLSLAAQVVLGPRTARDQAYRSLKTK